MSNYRILLLDYEPRSIAQTKVPLEAAGFQVDVATDGLAGIEAFNQLHPDLVLIEAMLPKKHGFEVCQEIKRTPEGKRTPIVITTGVYRGRKYRSQALHIHGCDEYLEKPFASDLLISLCTRFLTGGAAAASTESADLASSSVTEALSSIADGADEISATPDSPHSYAASIIADLTEEEIIARLDALLPGDPVLCPAAPEEGLEPQDAPTDFRPAEASLEDLLEPLPTIAGDGEEADPGPQPAASIETPQAYAQEPLELGSVETASDLETWPPVPLEVEDASIESILDARFAAGGDEVSKFEDPQIVPFDASRSRKRHRTRSGAPAGSGSGVAAADAIAVTESAQPEVMEREAVVPAAVAGPAPEVRLEPTVRVARPTAAAVPATAHRRISWWVVAAALVVTCAAYYLTFKPAVGKNAMPPFVESSSGPDAVRVEPSAPAFTEPSRGHGAPERTVRGDRARPATASRDGMADEGASAAPTQNAKPTTPPAIQAAPTQAQDTGSVRKAWEMTPATPAETEAPRAEGAEPASEAGGAETGEPGETAIVPPVAPEPALPDLASPATARGALVPIEEVDTQPVARSRPAPTYTARARMLRQQGSVFLNLLVDENGVVAEVQMIHGIPASDLNDAARRAARTWTYHPATKDGVPVKVWKQEKINFTL